MVRTPSARRAWLVAHDARPAVTAMVLVAVALHLGGDRFLPVPGSPRPLPLWQLTPSALAVLASLVTVNRLPAPSVGAVGVARAVWALVVVGVAAGCARIVDLGTGLPTLVPATAVLTSLTFGFAGVVGRSSVWLGAATAVVIVMRTSTLAADESPWDGVSGAGLGVVLVLVTTGLVGYGLLGADRPGRG